MKKVFLVLAFLLVVAVVSCEPKGSVESTSVYFDKNKITLVKGIQYTIKATVMPSDAPNRALAWASNNSSVATVSPSGVVSAVGVGTATVVATTVAGGKSAVCEVVVTL